MKTPEEQVAATNIPPEENGNGVHHSTPSAPRGPRPISKEDFEVKNKRRLVLLDKEYDGGGLTSEEEAEMASLEADVDRYLDALPPTTEQLFAHLKETARRSGMSEEKLNQWFP